MDGSIKFDVSASTAKFDAAMGNVGNSARTAADGVKSAFAGLGALLAGGAVVSGLQNILRRMDDVSDAAKRLGATTTDIQKVGNAAQIVGTDLDAVARSMNKMGVQANKAARDGGDLAAAFDRVNIDPAKFAAAGLAERIEMVAAAQQAANGDARKMAELFEVVGIRAANINFTELVAEMQNVNAASESTVEALARANDELDKAKQNAAIFGANLLKALVIDPAERLGDILAGGSGKTVAEMDQQMLEEQAKARLNQRGALLSDDSRIGKKAISTPAGPVYTEGDLLPGPNALENQRLIAEEVAKIKKEMEGVAAATATATDELDEQTAKAKDRAAAEAETSRFKQQMLDIDLKIREAQLAGDKEKEASLVKFKEWTEAAIKYEGDLDKASRDVNATLKERLKLQEDALQKTTQQVAKEVKLAETMAFGTDEAKNKAKWMQVYDETLANTGGIDAGRYDLARRAANAATYEPMPTERNSGRGRGRGGGDSSLGPRSTAPATFNERVGELRGQARQRPFDQRASELAARGMYGSAIRNLMRGEKAFDDAMNSARAKDLAAMEDFAGRRAKNAGEAFQGFRERVGGLNAKDELRRLMQDVPDRDTAYNDSKSIEQNYKDYLKGLAKTPKELQAQEDQQRAAGGGGATQPTDPTTGKLDKIINIMEERLPIRVLAA